jgi:hypothetical protein
VHGLKKEKPGRGATGLPYSVLNATPLYGSDRA